MIFLCFSTRYCLAQTYKSKTVQETADSLLKASIGDRLFPYFERDPKSKYEYAYRGKIRVAHLRRGGKTRGTLINASIGYRFQHLQFTWIKGYTQVYVDSSLKSNKEINVSFIPKAIAEGKEIFFISKGRAEELANMILKERITKMEVQMVINDKTKDIAWQAINRLSPSRLDIIYIDPITENIISQELDVEYFRLH